MIKSSIKVSTVEGCLLSEPKCVLEVCPPHLIAPHYFLEGFSLVIANGLLSVVPLICNFYCHTVSPAMWASAKRRSPNILQRPIGRPSFSRCNDPARCNELLKIDEFHWCIGGKTRNKSNASLRPKSSLHFVVATGCRFQHMKILKYN